MQQNTFFSGLRVVEFASVLAGPAVGMFFAELGAEVIKIENATTGGDVTRGWKLPSENPESNHSAYFSSVNWGKKHLFLDLNNAEDLAQARALALEADVVLSNFKTSAAKRYGLDADALQQDNPRLICAGIQAFADPDDERPAFDVVLQAEAGFLYMTGEPGRPPVKMPVALIDLLTAHQLKEGILLALLHRERTGEGSVVTASLLESALASLANQATNYLMTGHIPQPMGTRHPNIVPYGDIFTCSDGEPLLLAVGTERQFKNLCSALKSETLSADERFENNSARVRNRDLLNTYLADLFRRDTAEAWLNLMHQSGVPAARIRNMQAVFDMPEARAMVLESQTADGQTAKCLQSVAFHWKA